MPQTGHLLFRFGGFWGFQVFGVSGRSRFRGGVVLTFVLHEHMGCSSMLETRHWVLGFACFFGFGVIWVSGWGRDDIRFT